MSEAVVVGYVVKEVSPDHPKGYTVGRVYHAKSAAEDLAKYMNSSSDKPEGAQYHVAEKLGY